MVGMHAVTVSEPAAAHPTALHPARRRNALPRPRLLIWRQHRNGIATIRLGLITEALHRRPHLLEALSHPRTL